MLASRSSGILLCRAKRASIAPRLPASPSPRYCFSLPRLYWRPASTGEVHEVMGSQAQLPVPAHNMVQLPLGQLSVHAPLPRHSALHPPPAQPSWQGPEL